MMTAILILQTVVIGALIAALIWAIAASSRHARWLLQIAREERERLLDRIQARSLQELQEYRFAQDEGVRERIAAEDLEARELARRLREQMARESLQAEREEELRRIEAASAEQILRTGGYEHFGE